MKNADAFGGYHPLVNFIYFALVIGFSMFFMHPVCLAVSLICAIAYHIRLRGGRAAVTTLLYALPAMLLAAMINPLFNHSGSTVLCRFPGGASITLESVLYGVAAAGMLVSVIIWFYSFSAVMTTDKLMYLFGRIIPSLSLLITMTLRFVPTFIKKLGEIREAQAGIGIGSRDGSVKARLKSAMTCFSAMVTWSLENAVDTADSMKSRGYGLRGRTSFSIYKFSKTDAALTVYLALCGGFIAACAALGALQWQYFPDMSGAAASPLTIAAEAVYFLLCITPLIIDGREDLKWRCFR
jgi:energy-coupling factor transport system permease protein